MARRVWNRQGSLAAREGHAVLAARRHLPLALLFVPNGKRRKMAKGRQEWVGPTVIGDVSGALRLNSQALAILGGAWRLGGFF
jgi:hypothetical protein